jgi:hypothetical protein
MQPGNSSAVSVLPAVFAIALPGAGCPRWLLGVVHWGCMRFVSLASGAWNQPLIHRHHVPHPLRGPPQQFAESMGHFPQRIYFFAFLAFLWFLRRLFWSVDT